MPRGRKPGFRMTEEHRAKIGNSNILNALIAHVEGKREMSATQVTAGIALLRKVLPDLSAAQLDVTHRQAVEEMDDAALQEIAAAARRARNGSAAVH